MHMRRIGFIATGLLPCVSAASVLGLASALALAGPDPEPCYGQISELWDCCTARDPDGEETTYCDPPWNNVECGSSVSGAIFVQIVDPEAASGWKETQDPTFVGNCTITWRECQGGQCVDTGQQTSSCDSNNPDMSSDTCEYEDGP